VPLQEDLPKVAQTGLSANIIRRNSKTQSYRKRALNGQLRLEDDVRKRMIRRIPFHYNAAILCFATLFVGAYPSYVYARRAWCIWYDACIESYNETFRFLPNYKAMAVPSTGDVSAMRCYWRYGVASADSAYSLAKEDCSKNSGHDCGVFADDDGLKGEFLRRIESLGGTQTEAGADACSWSLY
jgi:hypothetical protein